MVAKEDSQDQMSITINVKSKVKSVWGVNYGKPSLSSMRTFKVWVYLVSFSMYLESGRRFYRFQVEAFLLTQKSIQEQFLLQVAYYRQLFVLNASLGDQIQNGSKFTAIFTGLLFSIALIIGTSQRGTVQRYIKNLWLISNLFPQNG